MVEVGVGILDNEALGNWLVAIETTGIEDFMFEIMGLGRSACEPVEGS